MRSYMKQYETLNAMRGNSAYLATCSEGNAKKDYLNQVEALDTAMELIKKSEQYNAEAWQKHMMGVKKT